MAHKTLITLAIIILAFLLSFFTWHFSLSIYEIKVQSSANEPIVKTNSEIEIKTIGVNSLGWELPFRTIKSRVEIIEGKDLIQLSQIGNSIIIKVLDKEGSFTLKVFPILSLNPSEFNFKIEKY